MALNRYILRVACNSCELILELLAAHRELFGSPGLTSNGESEVE